MSGLVRRECKTFARSLGIQTTKILQKSQQKSRLPVHDGKNIQQYLILIVWVPPKPFLSFFSNISAILWRWNWNFDKGWVKAFNQIKVPNSLARRAIGNVSFSPFYCFTLMTSGVLTKLWWLSVILQSNLCMNDAFSLCSTSTSAWLHIMQYAWNALQNWQLQLTDIRYHCDFITVFNIWNQHPPIGISQQILTEDGLHQNFLK